MAAGPCPKRPTAFAFRLTPHFDQVNVVYVPGNHGRRSQKKDYHGAHDNWDYLIAELARLYCADIDNVAFVIPDAFSVNLDIGGVGFNISHGDDVRGSLGIPYYGLQRRQRSLTALAHTQDGPRIRYFCCGHFHKPGIVGDMDGEMLVNGPWVATDAYAMPSPAIPSPANGSTASIPSTASLGEWPSTFVASKRRKDRSDT